MFAISIAILRTYLLPNDRSYEMLQKFNNILKNNSTFEYKKTPEICGCFTSTNEHVNLYFFVCYFSMLILLYNVRNSVNSLKKFCTY